MNPSAIRVRVRVRFGPPGSVRTIARRRGGLPGRGVSGESAAGDTGRTARPRLFFPLSLRPLGRARSRRGRRARRRGRRRRASRRSGATPPSTTRRRRVRPRVRIRATRRGAPEDRHRSGGAFSPRRRRRRGSSSGSSSGCSSAFAPRGGDGGGRGGGRVGRARDSRAEEGRRSRGRRRTSDGSETARSRFHADETRVRSVSFRTRYDPPIDRSTEPAPGVSSSVKLRVPLGSDDALSREPIFVGEGTPPLATQDRGSVFASTVTWESISSGFSLTLFLHAPRAPPRARGF